MTNWFVEFTGVSISGRVILITVLLLLSRVTGDTTYNREFIKNKGSNKFLLIDLLMLIVDELY